jgi:hypothetical protein
MLFLVNNPTEYCTTHRVPLLKELNMSTLVWGGPHGVSVGLPVSRESTRHKLASFSFFNYQKCRRLA